MDLSPRHMHGTSWVYFKKIQAPGGEKKIVWLLNEEPNCISKDSPQTRVVKNLYSESLAICSV